MIPAGTPWLVSMHNGEWLVCLSCEARERVGLPQPLRRYVEVAKRFAAEHQRCPFDHFNWRRQRALLEASLGRGDSA